MLEFKKGTYVSRIWMLCHPDAGVDVMAQLYRELPNGKWQFDYRFRYYHDDKAHGSRDQKSGYKGTFPESISEDEVLKRVGTVLQPLADLLGEMFGTDPFEIDCCEIGTDEPLDCVRLLALKPWAHMKFGPVPN